MMVLFSCILRRVDIQSVRDPVDLLAINVLRVEPSDLRGGETLLSSVLNPEVLWRQNARYRQLT